MNRTGAIRGPIEYTIGAVDLIETSAYLSAFGFLPTVLPPVGEDTAQELYGLDGRVEQLVLSTIDQVGADVRLIQVPQQTAPMQPFECGAHGIDVYSSDLELTTRMAARTGGSTAEIVDWVVEEGWPLIEARMVAPGGGFAVYSPQSDVRFPSVFDSQPARPHSDIVMTSWFAPPHTADAERTFWQEEMGFRLVREVVLDEEDMVALQLQPRPARASCMQFMDDLSTARVDVLYYLDEEPALREDWPARAGLHSMGFVVSDLAEAVERLPSVKFSSPTMLQHPRRGPENVVSGLTPAGVRVELRQSAAVGGQA